MDVAARLARSSDAPAIATLEADARLSLAEQRGGPERLAGCTPGDAAAWAQRADDPDWHVVVGTLDDVVVAYAAARTRHEVATVTQLYVEPGARDVGIGEALIEELLAWAPTTGAKALEATALPGDRQTKNLFERFGMKARAITVSRRLG
ncbi:MAG: N-acetyltransferase family protein [Acidimicrobiia bacterium]